MKESLKNYLGHVAVWAVATFVSPMVIVFLMATKNMDKGIIAKFYPNLVGTESLNILSWISLAPVLVLLAAYLLNHFDTEVDTTEHSCDICGNKLKIGEGKHELSKATKKCLCICSRCLPTVAVERCGSCESDVGVKGNCLC